MKFYMRTIGAAWLDVLRHRLSLVVLIISSLILGLALFAQLDTLRGLEFSPTKEVQAIRLVHAFYRSFSTGLIILQLIIAVPLIGVEKFQGYLDLIWYRPLHRGLWVSLRVFGRSLYFLMFSSISLAVSAYYFTQLRIPTAYLWELAWTVVVFPYFSVLTMMYLLAWLGCITTTRFMHVIYWIGLWFIHQQCQVFYNVQPSSFWRDLVGALGRLVTALVMGASTDWMTTFYYSPQHLMRLLISLAFGLLVNIYLTVVLSSRLELFHD